MSAVLISSPLAIDPPEVFPISHLSASSIDLYQRCPIKWKRKHIDHQPEPTSGKMALGGAAGAALAQHYGRIIDGEDGLCTEAVLDEFSSEWENRISREEIDWGADSAGALKDSGAGALRVYHTRIAPSVVPVSVEREFNLSWPGVPFTLTGFIDLESADNRVVDYKMTDKRWSAEKAQAQLQPTIYLAARRAEENPAAGFDYHTMVRNKTPIADIVPAVRTERQLDLLTHRVFSIARSIEWRWLNDCWQGAPPGLDWMCRGCGYRDTCAWSLA